jgi:S-adenosylmethionine:tRNA ribosyltransferase-isomerase
MLVSDFDYFLPADLIAQEPAAERDRSRMLILDRAGRKWQDSSFAEFPTFVNKGDLIVINNTRVFPARLIGHRLRGENESVFRPVEALLIQPLNEEKNEWEVLGKPARALREGSELVFGNGRLRGVVTAVRGEGRREMRFEFDGDFDQIVDEIGNSPLPPYIKRELNERERLDEPRYQTVYAKERGAIAAPTAGLHFTSRIFDELNSRSIGIAEITHHVGYATFQPLRVERVEAHHLDSENYQISEDAGRKINSTRATGNRIIAVGTTTVRTLESASDSDGIVRSGQGKTELFIYPGYRFRTIDALLTNFHLPQSSLLMMVAAFAGRELVLEAYRHAVNANYRFYSYGDCMLII